MTLLEGDADQAERIYTHGLRLSRETGDQWRSAQCLEGLGLVAQKRGDHGAARTLLGESLERFQELGDVRAVAALERGLGSVAFAQGKYLAARVHWCRALTLRHEIGDSARAIVLLDLLAQAAAALGDRQCASRLEGAVASLSATSDPPLALASDDDLTDGLPRTRSASGEVAGSEARAEGLVMTLDEALDYALASAAIPPVALGQAGGAGVLEESPTPLTRREREVAALVADGLTNRQIAASLVITSGTAANHIDHIMTKLNVRSRAQVAVWAAGSGRAPARRA